jgi:DNA repair exonuclease SbcCD ATPase subunit
MNASVQKVLDLEKKHQDSERQLAEAKQVAIQELLRERGAIDEQLKSLGYDPKKAPAVKRQVDPNKKCPVCGETGHDARRHKNDPKPPAAAPPKPTPPTPTKPADKK